MKKTLFSIFLTATLAILVNLTQAQGSIKHTLNYVPDEIIVSYQPSVGAQNLTEYTDILEAEGIDYNYQIQLWDNTFLVKLNTDNVTNAAKSLADNPQVVYAEPNYLDEVFFTPNDPQWENLWGLQKISADRAWDLQTGSSKVIVAVVDTGVDPNHPELQGKLLPGYDFVSGDNDPHDEHGHGTHVAGTIAAITNNVQDVAGVAGGDAANNNLGVQVLPVRACGPNGRCRISDVGQGIRYAVDNGAYVINLSLGGTDAQTYRDTISYALQNGVVVVAAAGNDGVGYCKPPAAYDESICVIATNHNDQRASFSNYGRYADVAAPGTNIVSLRAGGGVTSASGTSMAAPHVSGLAALLYSFMPDRSASNAQTVRSCIENNLDVPNGWNPNWAPGRINAQRAVNDPNCNPNSGTPTPTTQPSTVPPSPTSSPTPSPTPTRTPTPPTSRPPTPSITLSSTPKPKNCSMADLNSDNIINKTDLGLLLDSYGKTSPDVNGDGVANQVDASIIISCWD